MIDLRPLIVAFQRLEATIQRTTQAFEAFRRMLPPRQRSRSRRKW